MPLDEWMVHAHEAAVAHMSGLPVKEEKGDSDQIGINGTELELFKLGKEIYAKEGYCTTCHQPDGKGLSASGISAADRYQLGLGSEERLIKVVLKGLLGPIEVQWSKNMPDRCQ